MRTEARRRPALDRGHCVGPLLEAAGQPAKGDFGDLGDLGAGLAREEVHGCQVLLDALDGIRALLARQLPLAHCSFLSIVMLFRTVPQGRPGDERSRRPYYNEIWYGPHLLEGEPTAGLDAGLGRRGHLAGELITVLDAFAQGDTAHVVTTQEQAIEALGLEGILGGLDLVEVADVELRDGGGPDADGDLLRGRRVIPDEHLPQIDIDLGDNLLVGHILDLAVEGPTKVAEEQDLALAHPAGEERAAVDGS